MLPYLICHLLQGISAKETVRALGKAAGTQVFITVLVGTAGNGSNLQTVNRGSALAEKGLRAEGRRSPSVHAPPQGHLK